MEETNKKFYGDFESALTELKAGGRVARMGWNVKDMWLILVGPKDYDVEAYMTFDSMAQGAYIAIHTADKVFTPWLASQTDLLAEDWTKV